MSVETGRTKKSPLELRAEKGQQGHFVAEIADAMRDDRHMMKGYGAHDTESD